MIESKKYLSITFSTLFIGLRNDWLTTKEVITLVNSSSEKLNCNEDTLLNFNLNEDDKIEILRMLEKLARGEENLGSRLWQLANLVAIEKSEHSIHKKLKEIEAHWSKFDYPESWRNFIYYMPNKNANTEEGIYQIFLNFIEEEKKILDTP